MEEEDYVFLTLRCRDCEQDNCIFQPIGSFVRNKEGCTRKVSEETAAKFKHYTEEVMPFWRFHSLEYVKKAYEEVINFLFSEIYSAPIGQRLDPDGKVRLSGY